MPENITLKELVNNPNNMIPIVLCLDISASMQDEDRIGHLNSGVKMFYDALNADNRTKYSVDIAVVTFGDKITVLQDFSLIANIDMLSLRATGLYTKIADGIEKSLELLEQRKSEYKNLGKQYYQPWLVVITDGCSNPSFGVKEVQEKIKNLENNGKLTTFFIKVGSDECFDELNDFSIRGAKKLSSAKFEELFQWLSQSTQNVSNSKVGDKVKLPPTKNWEEI
jgi:uncharacterized protein YegL